MSYRGSSSSSNERRKRSRSLGPICDLTVFCGGSAGWPPRFGRVDLDGPAGCNGIEKVASVVSGYEEGGREAGGWNGIGG